MRSRRPRRWRRRAGTRAGACGWRPRRSESGTAPAARLREQFLGHVRRAMDAVPARHRESARREGAALSDAAALAEARLATGAAHPGSVVTTALTAREL